MTQASIQDVLARAGLVEPGQRPRMEPLAGGVSSDIWRVELGHRVVCVKRALAKLKVSADWRAPVERNAFEAEWMRVAAAVDPRAVPRLLHHDPASGAIVMEYLEPASHPLWKDSLARGVADVAVARQVGSRIGQIHAATARRPELAQRFKTDAIFKAIRLEPYLVAAAAAHPDLSSPLMRLAERTASTRLALVHGDVSPKNILVGPEGPVFLDAECAWWGDPAFDLAFCLNHLLLKCLWVPAARHGFLACFDALAQAHLAAVDWEEPGVTQGRVASLLPGLMLARIDGKSPIEYIILEPQKMFVRTFARAWVAKQASSLSDLRDAWAAALDNDEAKPTRDA